MRLFFLLLPWLELFTLIQLGVETSALTAIFYVLATFVLGLAVLRRQGVEMFNQMRNAQQGGVLGRQLLVDDMAVGLAGVLLAFPGMITDFVALCVLIGPLRRRLARLFGAPEPEPYRPQYDQSADSAIEGQYTRVDDERTP
ncbi:FxsA family protein [Halioglobus maricola]|uniref:FxsA family protein n=1 Tax=Halioglobus maricola TaxID=2601894 RepID=A0A5P9NQI1_9GAMM|nr:FxsA family protein [Halioglobus maricola]QFU77909.1 FxsA family protein [Halioglobus maricola]